MITLHADGGSTTNLRHFLQFKQNNDLLIECKNLYEMIVQRRKMELFLCKYLTEFIETSSIGACRYINNDWFFIISF